MSGLIEVSREIKFRGRKPGGKEWFYGFYVKSWFSNSSYIIPMEMADVNNPFDQVLTAEHTGQIGWYEVDPRTVGQFTGLVDRDGKDIYEGDVVEVQGGKKPRNKPRPLYRTEVVYDAPMFKLKDNRTIYLDCVGVRFSTVIGTIHDEEAG